MAAALLALAAAVAVTLGAVGLARIEPAWLRWLSTVGYVLIVVALFFGVPILLGVTHL